MATPSAHPIGIAPLTHLELSPPEQVDNAAAAGFDAVGLRLVAATPSEPQYDMRPGSASLAETFVRLRGSDLSVLDIEIFRLKPDTRLADYLPFLDAGAQLGARHALVAFQDPDRTRLADNFAAFCEMAQGLGMGADVEPTPWYEIPSLAETLAVIEASGVVNAGLVVDPIHFDRAGESTDSLRQMNRARFRYAQICDAPALRPADTETLLFQARAERMAPGDGGLPLRALLAALPQGIPLSVEVPMQFLARSMDARRRAAWLLDKTRAFLGASCQTDE